MSETKNKYSRSVCAVRVGADGRVSEVCGAPGTWPARTARHVVEDIELGLHAYHVYFDGETAEVVDANDGTGRFLQAKHPDTAENVLLQLPRF